MGVFDGVELNDLVLTGQRLTLRPWRADDADAVAEVMNDERLHRFLLLPDPYTQRDAVDFVTGTGDEGRADGSGLGCAVVETATGVLVGSAALRLPTGRTSTSAEIGYWCAPRAWGRGYATEATRVLASWAFEHGVARVEIRCAPANLASIRTAMNAGFRYEGLLRSEGRTAADPSDMAMFARVPGDDGERVEPALPVLPPDGLTDGVIRLRAFEPGDVEAELEQELDAVSLSWRLTEPLPTREQLASQAAGVGLGWLVGPVGRMTIVDVASGAYAGSIQLQLYGPPRVGGIGYGMHPAFRGRRYTSRALVLLTAWAFEHGNFVRLELGAKVANLASQKSALTGGFRAEGVSAARLTNPDGTASDEARFGLVNPTLRPGPELSR